MILLLAIAIFVSCENWVILLAGSNGYENYRHQADICQAYQQIKAGGVPDERIIVWMYDDIANNDQNPKKGTIINYIGGPDVYNGVPKDYTGDLVVPENFLKMLKGEDMTGIGSGKTLKSTAEDNIFLYFADHGGPGIICFPGFIELGVDDLMDALETLHSKNMYKKFVFYMEACESGSMFYNHLKPEWNIYGVTASNPTESSWACDYSDEYEAYLNDCWSRDWLNDTRTYEGQGALFTRTLDEQFKFVKTVSTKSPECRYGDLSFVSDVLGDYQGQRTSDNSKPMQFPAGRKSDEPRVAPYDVPLQMLVKEGNQEKIDAHKEYRNRVDLRWDAFRRTFKLEQQPSKSDDTCETTEINGECVMAAINEAKTHCGRFDDYSAQYYKLLSQACNLGVTPKEMGKALQQICFVA